MHTKGVFCCLADVCPTSTLFYFICCSVICWTRWFLHVLTDSLPFAPFQMSVDQVITPAFVSTHSHDEHVVFLTLFIVLRKKKLKKIVDTFGCLFVRFYIVYNALLWTAVVLLSECLGWWFCIDSGRFHGRTDERLPKNLVSSFPFPFGLCVVWPRPSVVRLDGSVVSFAFTDFRFFCRTVKVLNDGGDKQRW